MYKDSMDIFFINFWYVISVFDLPKYVILKETIASHICPFYLFKMCEV